jgi:uncharacterized protein (TIGR02118 family)
MINAVVPVPGKSFDEAFDFQEVFATWIARLLARRAPRASATYVAMGHLYFDSTDAFQAAFAPHAQSILADIPNYINTQPIIQVSEFRL